MAKSLKLRISRVFQSCISKDPSTLPHNPLPLFLRLPPGDPKVNGVDSPATPPVPAPPRPSKPHHRHLRSSRPSLRSAVAFIGCGLRPRSSRRCLSDDESAEYFKWQEEEKWHVVAKVPDGSPPRRKMYNSSVSAISDDDVPPPPPPSAEKKKRRGRRKKAKSASRLVLRTSTSSAESGIFSSEADEDPENYNAEEEDETETLVSSSRSFSSDSSSEFNPHLETIREAPVNVGSGSVRRKTKKAVKKKKKKKKKKTTKRAIIDKGKGWSSPESGSPARLSVFQRLIACRVEGKVKESFAVVKRSEEPYEDFKRSMMDMILEKQMYEPQDLEQLLHCFLSLNSHHHHPFILAAFSDIWEALFSRSACKSS
ncbi:transcription repressor OFP7 [Malania oleifera]|uniref:transcription repressor OFP7 n=1 Tax=Malania oleifera TaxID=397392 RepID=UPI0025ADFBC7|nr:transcription repressor OFP7 [Malania oleifera]